uniref:Roadblock/LAMTOR2 domain-containing protein n=1 Tax=candidate division WOR-3 bacterium TaxID=2052148 RepID=A0A7C4TAX9_UNCW3
MKATLDLSQLTKIPRVLGAGLATYDGFIVDSQFVHGYDSEKFGAMAAKIMTQIQKSLGPESGAVILYTEDVVFLAKLKQEGILFVLGDREANLGLIKIKFEKM